MGYGGVDKSKVEKMTVSKVNSDLESKSPIPLSDRLMELAGYSKISATSCVVRISSRLKASDSEENINLEENTRYACLGSSARKEIPVDRQCYVPFYLNNKRVVGLMDSGSEITIIHLSLFKRVFLSDSSMQTSDLSFIRSFSAGEIPILGMKSIQLKPDRYKPGISITLYIIQDIPGVPIFLVGFNVFSQGMIDFNLTGLIEDPTPEIIFKQPTLIHCTVFYESPRSLDICIATDVSLKPYELKWVDFMLSCAAPVIKTDIILISSRKWDTINVIPSRTRIELVSPSQRYHGKALLANTSNMYIENVLVYARYELINDYDMVNISNENLSNLKQALFSHPFGREIIYSGQNAHNDIYVPTVNKVSMEPAEEGVMVSDADYADTVMGKEPTMGVWRK
jgi:hypothetical protein